jgi:predicted nucleic acid-binding protein
MSRGFLLDTNIPSELSRPRPSPAVTEWLEATNDQLLFLSVITVGEISKGFTVHSDASRRETLRTWLYQTLRPWFAGRILPITESIAERWGQIEGHCQKQGITISAPDGLIAATAIEHDLALVTRNVKDFAGVNVRIFNPWDDT